ncbi:hypothetical protein KRX11_04990 [Pasteurellaceae bacterium TAE3-ERU1]|nr:hypothetical protein [Spirabiliibacterium mucosae]MBE2897645.1 hypothetical protein [Spirabiliibacterium mucosae]MBV7388005.1 hypothetical protein [Pasteurellaceae bacterium TAE3-ERU1]
MKRSRTVFKKKPSLSLMQNRRRLLRMRHNRRVKSRIEERHWLQFLAEND